MSIAMRYGDVNDSKRPAQGLRLIGSGEIVDNTLVQITFEAGGMYLLCTSEYNASTGAYRGHRIISIQAPQKSIFGTTDVNKGNVYASSNSGVSITYNNDSTVSIVRSSATYAFRYALYKVL